jgi:hypothetical protein
VKRQPIDMAIRNTLTRRNDREPGNCPDNSLIAAYLESRLQSDEAARFEAHAAVCASCREILALSMQLAEEPAAPPTAPSTETRRVILHFAIPVSVMALVLLASFAALLYYRTIREAAKESAVAATAEVRAPAKAGKAESPAAPIAAPASAARQEAEKKELDRLEKERGSVAVKSSLKPAQALNELQPPAGTKGPVPTDHFDARARLALEAEAVKSKSSVSIETISPPSPVSVGGVMAPANFPREAELRAKRAGGAEEAASDSKDMQLQKAAPSDETEGASARFARGDQKSALDDQPPSPDTRTVGGRTFTKITNVWVDDECRKHPSVERLQIKRDSSEFDEIRRAIQGIEDLLTDTVRVQVFWKGRIYLVRP